MPSRHLYEGDCGKQYEKIYPSVRSKIPSKIKCPCKAKRCSAEILWEAPKKSYAYVRELVYYENKSGEISVPTDINDPSPGAGWQRKSTGLMNEIERIERRVNSQEITKASAFREVSHQQALAYQDHNRKIMLDGERWEDDEGNEHYAPPFYERSEAGKDLARAAIEISNSRLTNEMRAIDPGAHFRFLHYDERKR